jgi:hypothetical protein
VAGGVLGHLQDLRRDVAEREVGDGVLAGLVKEHNVLAVGDPVCAEADSHAAAQRLGEQQPTGQRLRDEEPSDRGWGRPPRVHRACEQAGCPPSSRYPERKVTTGPLRLPATMHDVLGESFGVSNSS